MSLYWKCQHGGWTAMVLWTGAASLVFGTFQWLGIGAASLTSGLGLLLTHHFRRVIHWGGWKELPPACLALRVLAAAGLRGRVAEGDLDGLLTVHPNGTGVLFTRREVTWAPSLQSHLSMALSLYRLAESGRDPATLAHVQAPFQLEQLAGEPARSRAATVTALIALGLALYALFTGIG